MVDILAPIFAVVLLGYLCRRFGIFGPNAYVELNRYVVCLALPALLFDIVAHLRLEQLNKPEFLGAFAIGSLVTYALPLLLQRGRRPFADAALDGLSASYPNTGFIGLPLALLAFGPSAGPGSTIAAVWTACVLFALAIALLEMDVHRGHAFGTAVRRIAGSLVRNPIVVAPLMGIIVAASGWELPIAANGFVKLIAVSAGPCALVSLGLFLARDMPTKAGQRQSWIGPLMLVALKLLFQPLVTALLCIFVFGLKGQDAQLVVLLSALPTGTGAFMLADYYKRDPGVTSTTILVSTIASVLTLSACLALLPRLL